MTFEKLNNLMSSSLWRSGAVGRVKAAVIADTLTLLLKEMYGELASQVKVSRVKDMQALITCGSSVLAEEVGLNKEVIIDLTNQRLGGIVLKSIKVVV